MSNSTMILTGVEPAEKIQNLVKTRAELFFSSNKRRPKLVVIWVGESEASRVYTNKKSEIAKKLSMESVLLHYPNSLTADELEKSIQQLNNDPDVDGILVQRPLPRHLETKPIHLWISPEKDVDCFHPFNLGNLMRNEPSTLASCTPMGVMAMLDYYNISVAKKLACVIGRSLIVGKPMAQLLVNADATVIQVHSKTEHPKTITQLADIVIVAAGQPEFFGRDAFKKGSIVIDVGIHRNAAGKIVGDCRSSELAGHVAAYSPVPKGVGPMTIALLMQNTVLCAENRVKTNR